MTIHDSTAPYRNPARQCGAFPATRTAASDPARGQFANSGFGALYNKCPTDLPTTTSLASQARANPGVVAEA